MEPRHKVLIVDDEPIVRTLVRAVLVGTFDVFEAEGGPEALKLLAGNQLSDLDLLLTDIRMPGMDGITLANCCRQDRPDLKVVFMSGYSDPIPEDNPAHAFPLIPKPFSPDALLTTVLNTFEKQ